MTAARPLRDASATGRVPVATNGNFEEAKPARGRSDVGQLWRNATGRFGSIPGDRPGDLPAEYRSLTDDRA